MRKEEIASLIVYLFMIVLAIIVGLTAVKSAIDSCGTGTLNPFGFVLLVIFIGLIVNIIMLELLHALGGLIGGYGVASINILGLHFEKKDKKLTLKLKDFDGLTGETKLYPKKDKLNMKPYVWLPLFGYVAELAGGIVLYSNMMSNPASNACWLGTAAILWVVISSMIALYNLTPIKLDTMTDGYKLVLISKPSNIEAYNDLLKAEHLEKSGLPVPEFKIYEDITEFTANINLFTVYKSLDEDKLEEAEKVIDLMLQNHKKLEPYTYYRLISQKLFIVLMTKDLDESRKIYDELADDKIRRFIANDVSMESLRAYILISGLLEKSQGEIGYAISKKEKAMKRAMKQRAIIEEKLYGVALNKVYEAHPKWKEEKENAAD